MNSTSRGLAKRFPTARAMLLAAGLLLLAPRANGQALTTINFDDIPGSSIRSVAGNRYHSQGVLLSTTAVGGLFAHNTSSTGTPPAWIYGSSSASGSGADGNVIANFVMPNTNVPRPVSFVSFYVRDVGS